MSERRLAIPERSGQTRTLVRMLEQTQINGVVTHAEMTAAIGLDTQGSGYHHLRSACLYLLRTAHMVFAPVVNEGVKRLDDAGKVSEGERRIGLLRRQSKRALRVLASVDDFAALLPPVRTKHNVLMAQFGAIRAMSSDPAAKKLAGKVGEERQSKFSPAESLRLIESSL